MSLSVIEQLVDAFGSLTNGTTSVGFYAAFANDIHETTVGDDRTLINIPNLQAIYRVMIVAVVAVLAHSYTRPRPIGFFLGAAWAFIVSSLIDAFNEVIMFGVFNVTGAIPIYATVWCPQGIAHMIITNAVGAAFGTAFCYFTSALPFVQWGVDFEHPYHFTGESETERKTELARFVRMAGVWQNSKPHLLLRLDFIISWFIAPLLVWIGYWFTFWGMFKTLHGYSTVFRVDLLVAMFVGMFLVAIVYGLYIFMAKYPAFMLSYKWVDYDDFAGTTPPSVDLYERAARVRHLYCVVLLLTALFGAGAFCWGKILPYTLGFFYQAGLGAVVGMLLAYVVVMILWAVPVKYGPEFIKPPVMKVGDSATSRHSESVYHTLPGTGSLRAGNRARPDAM
ncbi:MAG: hypothetical protein WC732_09965 [Candidatus Omnitrophota bacterium]